MTGRRALRAALAWALLAALGGAALASAAPRHISLWVHSGPGPEREVYPASIRAFRATNPDLAVDLKVLPEGSYGGQVRAAAFAHKLPDVLEFDGPNVSAYAWSQRIIPLDRFPAIRALRADLLPTLLRQGTYRGRLYSVGQYDSGLAIWGNRRLLARAGVTVPTRLEDAWDLPALEAALRRLKASGVPHPLDMKFNYGMGEWFTYGFTPIVQSLGGDLVDRNGYRTAQGWINGPAAVRALTLVQAWVRAGYVNAAARDDGDFIQGRAALSWVGHWAYGTYRKALGDDLVLIPMPRFGTRAVTGAGSWSLGISADSQHPEAAARLVAFLMGPREIARVTAANGAVPGTRTALRASSWYRPGGPLAIFAEQLEAGLGRVRPETPAYPVISSAFAEAVNNIVAGADVRTELDRAARKIDEDLDDNQGYPAP
jgi:multiple sugar transport system substrate-binding protein